MNNANNDIFDEESTEESTEISEPIDILSEDEETTEQIDFDLEDEDDIRFNNFEELIQRHLDDEVFIESDILDADEYNEKSYREIVARMKTRVEEETKASVYEEVMGGMSDTMKFVYQQELNGANAKDYLKIILDIEDTLSLDIENPRDQETIVREYYKSINMPIATIDKKIAKLKSRENDLYDEAFEFKDELVSAKEKEAMQKAHENEQAQLYKKQREKQSADRVTQRLLTGLSIAGSRDKAVFSKEEGNELLSGLFVEYEHDLGKGKQLNTTIGHLIDYHKYAPKGDPERLIKAAMILDPNGKYDTKLLESMKKEAINLATEKMQQAAKSKVNSGTSNETSNKKKFNFK